MASSAAGPKMVEDEDPETGQVSGATPDGMVSEVRERDMMVWGWETEGESIV